MANSLMATNQRVNILLVDDQPSRLLSYEAILGGLGQNLVQATSGVEALKCLMESEFAVILLDVSMPGMDGFETAEMIHQHPRFEKTPIIFVTALHVTDMDRMKGYELGAVDYVYVPVVPEILRSKVGVLVELHCKRRELQEINRALTDANADLTQANSTLQAEKRRELESLNLHLELANAELATANRTLQRQIAERERLEVALRDADRRKDEFLAILAHELRNPLAPIRNAVHLMRKIPIQDPAIAWSRDAIDRQVELLVRLVDDLLDVSRITQGKIKLNKAKIVVKEVIANAIDTSRQIIDDRGHQLAIELPNEPMVIEGDLTRLAQVLSNLLNNAAKYTDEGGRIRLKVEPDVRADGTGEAVIRVIDSGVGIPPEVLPELFQLFAQVERTLDRSQGGLGIGLALVRRLVELHGGSVSAHSEGPGRGSEFVVRLPLLQEPTLGAPTATTATSPSVQQAKLRFLVVDDNVDSARSMGLLLKASGCDATSVFDGHSAIETAERERPDIVLLDLGMAGLNGYETARRLRDHPWGQQMLLIAVTGWGQQEARDQTKSAGFDGHLVKPAELHSIMELVQQLHPKI
jgi:signal transduction histidine kinase